MFEVLFELLEVYIYIILPPEMPKYISWQFPICFFTCFNLEFHFFFI